MEWEVIEYFKKQRLQTTQVQWDLHCKRDWKNLPLPTRLVQLCQHNISMLVQFDVYIN